MARFKCEICNRRYRMKSLYILHIRFEHPEEARKICTSCATIHSSNGKLFKHIRRENHLECNVCEGRFDTFYLLLGHYITRHQGYQDQHEGEVYECFECERIDHFPEIIIEHWYRVHGSYHIGRLFCLR
ncbi:unnamed protein product [Hymenolepis diminuta]|uniref:C2H2-type domain-containing protein n=1 Tax=Hymenolepis diminuta TaxID=6216 RepID=A0A564ZA96_HYMDI|nr:unnamed protein product [Hymenolepis diminuta]